MSAYVLQADDGQFVTYDDKGPGATGYPYLDDLSQARVFRNKAAAESSIESAMQSPFLRQATSTLTVKTLTVV